MINDKQKKPTLGSLDWAWRMQTSFLLILSTKGSSHIAKYNILWDTVKPIEERRERKE